MSIDGKQRARDLLADKALSGLDPEERDELARLLAEGAASEDDMSLEAAAAAVQLASLPAPGPLPAALAASVERAGRSFLAEPAARAAGARKPLAREPARPEASTTAAGAQVVVMPIASSERRDWARWAGWAAAAACAGLLVAQAVRASGRPPPAALGSASAPSAPSSIGAGTRTVALVAPAGGATAGGASGDLEWSEAAARGVIRARALPAGSYEIWIEDAGRDAAHPLAAGAFIARDGADSVAPVAPAIAPRRATRVVVSSSQDARVVLVATM